jgi:hypothetical protein
MGSGARKGSGSSVKLRSNLPVWSFEDEHADAPKGRANAAPATSPSFMNFPRDIFM